MMESFVMGGYGVYVWVCFGLTFGVIAVSDLLARSRQRKVYRDIEVRIKALEEQE